MASERITIDIMPGEVEAQAEVLPGPPTDRSALDEALRDEGVVFGIDEEACAQLGVCLQDPDFAIQELVLAQGTAPVSGADGVLELKFNINVLAGRLREDGTLDFRDRGLLVPLEAGGLLGIYTPPGESRTGRSVEGRELPADTPRDPLPCLGDGVELDSESGEIRATVAGIVSYPEGATLSVTSSFQHNRDVDLKSGDLQMEGALQITGDVARNASASATGDLVVNGMVDGGTVRANGSVTIGGGVIGSEGPLSWQAATWLATTRTVQICAAGGPSRSPRTPSRRGSPRGRLSSARTRAPSWAASCERPRASSWATSARS